MPRSQMCPFCGGGRTRPYALRRHHQLKRDHGPFDVHTCLTCGSGLTFPLPSPEQLAGFYEHLQEQSPGTGLADRDRAALRPLYEQSIRRALEFASPRRGFTWMDIGAGLGILSETLAERAEGSTGIAVDLHDRPAGLDLRDTVEWRACDLNDPEFATLLDSRADLVFSMSVWEHVLAPDTFLANVLALLEPGGTAYLVCPDFGSLARRALGTRWPFFRPGEHLFMPSRAGAVAAARRQCGRVFPHRPVDVRVRPIGVPYSLAYYARFAGLRSLARRVPASWAVPFRIGALEVCIRVE